ncbi:hypothetical protein GCM10023335_71810 [Streptomyces siamensis]|uniref:Uncharacterized protein n=1 Tax=Streptomyces siamensis TaxID=1274986 RepID=A0ABP9JJC7_9ACTN
MPVNHMPVADGDTDTPRIHQLRLHDGCDGRITGTDPPHPPDRTRAPRTRTTATPGRNTGPDPQRYNRGRPPHRRRGGPDWTRRGTADRTRDPYIPH